MPEFQQEAPGPRSLSALGRLFAHRRAGADGDPTITSVVLDSRRASAGALFAALPGLKDDGRAFLADAVRQGAVAALGPAPAPSGCPVPYLEAESPRRAVALAASDIAGRPDRRLVLCGVTGTAGKTTTAALLDAALGVAHPLRGLFGTLGYRAAAGPAVAATHTTPEATDLLPRLAALVRADGTAATMEVSSHALALDRVAGLTFDLALFTNLSRDHLDFHPTFAEYFAAKSKLFELLKPGGRAVVNADDTYGRRLMDKLPRGVVHAFTLERRAFCELSADVETTPEGLLLRCRRASTGESFEIRSPLCGMPNAANLAAASAGALALGLPAADVARALGAVTGVAGRLERVANERGIAVFVDYAHKPAALESVLRALRPMASSGRGDLRVVFGCGGDRDRGKRPEMGALAARLADDVVLTSDNPRSEDPMAIIGEIDCGVRDAEGRALIEPDRRAAINMALSRARSGDVVLVAGKGHETYQTVAGVDHPFDDREVVRAWFAAAPPRSAAAAAGA